MISLYSIFTILIFHWIFDFFLQTDEQAINKSKSNYALWNHVVCYSACLGFILLLNASLFHVWWCGLTWIAVNAIAHFFTDYVTSRASSLLFKENNYHDAFVVIGFDQMIHYITLFGTFLYCTQQ